MTGPVVVAAEVLAVEVLAVDADQVGAGPWGLLVVVLMIGATVLLVRNMNARLRRLPRDFASQRDEDGPAAQEPPRR